MMTLRLVLAALLLGVGSLDLADGPHNLALAIVGLVVGVALLATVAIDTIWPPDAQTAP